jgi:hypothetical protein
MILGTMNGHIAYLSPVDKRQTTGIILAQNTDFKRFARPGTLFARQHKYLKIQTLSTLAMPNAARF